MIFLYTKTFFPNCEKQQKSFKTNNKYLIYPNSILNNYRSLSTLHMSENCLSSPCENYYKHIVCRDMILKYGYKNIMEIASLKNIVVNTTSKMYVIDKKYMAPTLTALEMITGQKLIVNQAKKSIATFKIRKGQPIACKVTLRGFILYSFLYKLIMIILPRSRDFNGISLESIDNSGNWSVSVASIMLFPELESHYEFFETVRAFNITIGVSARKKQQACVLYSALQIPIL